MLLDGLILALRELLFLVSYVSGYHSFPQPLKPEEEAEMLQKFAEGDMQARNTLVERNLRLVAYVAQKYSSIGRHIDDLISIGTVGLIKGISTFDANKGAQLATYAARCIENEILMTIRAAKKQKNEISLQEAIGTDSEGNEISLMEILGSGEDDIIESVDTRIQIGKMHLLIKKILSKRERFVVELRYGLCGAHPMTQNEVARILGISRSYISRIEKRAVLKLRKEMQ